MLVIERPDHTMRKTDSQTRRATVTDSSGQTHLIAIVYSVKDTTMRNLVRKLRLIATCSETEELSIAARRRVTGIISIIALISEIHHLSNKSTNVQGPTADSQVERVTAGNHPLTQYEMIGI